jgi:hypothetical protein
MVFQGGENEGYANIAAAASFVQHGARGIGVDLVCFTFSLGGYIV